MPSLDLILLDLGGPIVSNGIESGYPPVPMSVVRALGLSVSQEELDHVTEAAVSAYGVGPTPFVLWQLCRPDRECFDRGMSLVWAHYTERGVPPLRSGVPEVLSALSATYRLGLLSNYPIAVQRQFLEAHDLLDHFPRLIDQPFRKPDPRALANALEVLGADADRSVLVGDRRDCDIAMANRMGVRSVLLVDGFYRNQRPRTPEDEPTAAIDRIEALPRVLTELDGGRQSAEEPPEAEGQALYRSRGCFACGTENRCGLELAPSRSGEEVSARFEPKPVHRGWSRLVHGGILATALDEVICLAVAQRAGSKVLTARAEIRYRAPAFLGRELVVSGRPTRSEGPYAVGEGEIRDAGNTLIATATLYCLSVDEARAARFLEREARTAEGRTK